MKKADLYWLAGYLEGEGTFFYHSLTYTPRVGLQASDRDVVRRAAMLMRGRAKGPLKRSLRNPKHKPIWYCQVYGQSARELMLKLHPLMGSRRKRQIKNALNSVDTRRVRDGIKPLAYKGRRRYGTS